MDQQALTLKYDGFLAHEGEMDAREVAEAIRGFADFSGRIAEVMYGRGIQVQSTVRGVREGSLEIPFLIKFTGEALGILASMGLPIPPMDFLKILAECIKLLKALGGSKPTNIKKAENGSVLVETNNGTIVNVNQLTVQLVMDPQTTRAAQKFVRKPLQNSAEVVKILTDHAEEIAKVNRQEAAAFVPMDGSNVLVENTSEVYVTISTATLRGKTRWRFYDGKNSFSADIEDQDFLARVDQGQERFGKHDALFVRLRTRQKQFKGKLRAEYAIEEVMDYLPSHQLQGRFL